MNVSSLEGGGGNKWYPWLWINIFEAISLSNTTLSIRCLISRNRDGWYNINGRKRNINALAGGQSHEKCTEATRAAYVIFAWGIKRLFANEKCPSLKRSNAVGLGYHIYIQREYRTWIRIAVKRRPDKVFPVIRSTFDPCFPVFPRVSRPPSIVYPKFPFSLRSVSKHASWVGFQTVGPIETNGTEIELWWRGWTRNTKET